MQESLFERSALESIALTDGELSLYRHWMTPAEADEAFACLLGELAWEQSIIRIQGRRIPIPRLNAWYGDPGANYQYSGIALQPRGWTACLARIKRKLEATVPATFNSVLANFYRDGQDSVAWHSDDEPELGKNPVIASVSLGAERRFVLRHRRRKDLARVELWLPSGSLLVMSGATQHNWHHQLPKTSKPVDPRINLTFRNIRGLSLGGV